MSRFSRVKILRNFTFLVLAIIAIRLFFIQIVEHDMWVAKADAQHTLLETITAKRGEIYMMNDNEPVPVVLNQTVYQVIIDPSVTDKEAIKTVLEENAKEYITADFDEVYSIEGLRYYIVAKKVPYSVAVKIAEADIPNVWLKEGNSRVYPEGEMGSTLLGFVNADGVGQYGVEGSLNQILAGEDGLLKTTADINKVALSIGKDNIKIPAKDGQNVVLSVDRGLEKGAEEIVANHLENSIATNAAFLIMDPNTSEVLAMSSLPNYTPSNYGNVKDASVYINQVTEVPYEPASICKNFAYSAAINEGKMNADTTYFNEPYVVVDGVEIWNAAQRDRLNYHTLTMRDGLYWSLNAASIHALKLLGDDTNSINATGRERLYDYYYNKFRLGQSTGIELIEAEGFIWDPHAEIYGLNAAYANMTFGQNLSITMIQTATAFSAVVNGGYWRTPTIIRGTLANNTITPLENRKVIEDHILSTDTSTSMRDMLINNRNWRYNPNGYDLGGKSGTAQVVINGAYDNEMNNLVGSYIGFIGQHDELPSLIIMVRMWGEGQAVGSDDPMEVFESLANFAIDYLKIQPKA